ncbi:MAG: radical SAM protein [Bacilli bacterium]|nr:radical SAM protein [Bacilli bacterium]
MKYLSLPCKSALHSVKNNGAFKWDLNIYRGCAHGCKYCFAMYSHDYLNDGNFFDTVYYKENVVDVLAKELASSRRKKAVISIGGVTDSYQPIERTRKTMRDVLNLMIQYKNPIIISTKSILILRDLDLIEKLAKVTSVHIAFTITTMDENVRKFLEPGGSPSLYRFKALSKIKETGATIGVHIMPIVPYLTDSYQNLDRLYALASKINASYVLPCMLYLRGKTKTYFLDSVRREKPEIYYKIKRLYENREMKKEYVKEVYDSINHLEKKYHMTRNYKKKLDFYKENTGFQQLSLFG